MGAPSIEAILIRSAPQRCEDTTMDRLIHAVNNYCNSPVRCKFFPNCAWRAKKRVFRVIKEHNLLVKPNLKLTAKRRRAGVNLSRPNLMSGGVSI
jgi:hypothetical protein